MRLNHAYNMGVSDALTKFALAPVTPADAFTACVDDGKPMPPPDAMLPPPPVPEMSNPNAPYNLSEPSADPATEPGLAEALAQFGHPS